MRHAKTAKIVCLSLSIADVQKNYFKAFAPTKILFQTSGGNSTLNANGVASKMFVLFANFPTI
jgi:hypothetical protein